GQQGLEGAHCSSPTTPDSRPPPDLWPSVGHRRSSVEARAGSRRAARAADLSHLCNGKRPYTPRLRAPATFSLYKNLNDAIGAGLGTPQVLQSECKVNTARLLRRTSCIRLVLTCLLCIKR